MRISIVIPVLNSHEIVRRQLLYFSRIGLPEGMELIMMDDGSDPPLCNSIGLPNIRIIPTHDTRPWTWAIARNAGARISQADYLLMTDIDYILPRKALDAAMVFTGDKMRFKREFGVLDENGVFTQDIDALRCYGLTEDRITRRGRTLPPHPNNFCIRRDLFWEMGGYREDLWDRPYPQGEDRYFKQVWSEFVRDGKAYESDHRPMIYMFPNGQFCGDVDYNPMGLFHDLSRKTERNPWHQRILQGEGR